MRIDQFLNTVNIVKSRQIAKDMIENKVIFLNKKTAKGSKTVSVGDSIKMVFLEYTKNYKILQIPASKTTKKSEQNKFVEEL